MPLAYSYSRVSSGQQVEGRGLGRQADMAAAWCATNGYTLDDTLDLSDAGRSAYSGEHLSKGALGRFLHLAQQRTLGDSPVLIVETVDRLSRQEPLDALQQVVFALVGAGVTIIDLEDSRSYDRKSLQGDALIMLVLKCRAAHDYSKRLGRRLADHWDSARQGFRDGSKVHRGGRGGRHPFWLTLDPAGTSWALIPERAELVSLIFSLLEEMGLSQVATELNQRGFTTSTGVKWAAETVGRVAADPAAYGALRLGNTAAKESLTAHRRWQKAKLKAEQDGTPFEEKEPTILETELISDHYPPVISYEQWLRIQDLIARRRHAPRAGRPGSEGSLSALQGLVTCELGSSMGVTHSNPQRSAIRHYLRCRARLNGKRCTCSGKGWHLPAIHAHVIRRLGRGALTLAKRRQAEPDVLQQKLEAARTSQQQITSRLASAERTLTQAIDAGASITLLERLNANVDALHAELAAANQCLEECRARCSAQLASITPDRLLTDTPALQLMKAFIAGRDTPEDRQALNRLLTAIGLRITLDGSNPDAPVVWLAADGIEPQTAPFLADAELAGLALETMRPAAPAGPDHPLYIGPR